MTRSKSSAGEWSGTPSDADSSSFVTVGSTVCVPPTIDDPVAVREQVVERVLLEICARSARARATRAVQQLDRHRIAVREPQALDREDLLARRDVEDAPEARAGGHTVRSSSVRLAGVSPRARMSSLNEEMSIPLATFGSATNVPAPRRRTR